MTKKEVDDWNETYIPGSPCTFANAPQYGEVHTISRAWINEHGHAVVQIYGLWIPTPIERLHMTPTVKAQS